MPDFAQQSNPYESTTSQYSSDPLSCPQPVRISIDPIDLLRRGYRGLGDQYWIFLAVSLVGVFIGSLVPMNILMGPMLVGIFLCAKERERSEKIEFGTLFRGFDQFLDSLIVIIALTVLSLLVLLPIAILLILVLGGFIVATGNSGAEPGLPLFMLLFAFTPVIIAASLACYIPFVFAFQLIADKKMGAVDAIKLSCRAAWMNLGGTVWYLIVVGLISFALSLMCYLPVFFFLPISFASLFALYRDVFPSEIVDAQQV